MVLALINTICVIISCCTSAANIWKHLKNYRKPMEQRLTVRILVMVPLFSLSAYLRLYSPYIFFSKILELYKEFYEAFVIYFFYSLLTSLLGGEREIIFETTGKPPVKFLWLNLDISDPHTFWVIKRMIMQYVWAKPVITVLMAINRSYWLNVCLIIWHNVTITLALNALTAFWFCLKSELDPYRVVLKFLSVKMIIFFSYWQSLALLVMSSFGLLSESSLLLYGNTLICVESLFFAYVHWLAFPASDFGATFMFGFARLRIDAAVRDSFGTADLVTDFRRTLLESRYGHRDFDSVESVMDHPTSQTRKKRLAAGLRYRNGGRSKYWLPTSSLKGLLQKSHSQASTAIAEGYGTMDPRPYAYSATPTEEVDILEDQEQAPEDIENQPGPVLDMEDQYSEGEEELYDVAKRVYGDYNYPVATVRETVEYISFQDRLRMQQVLESI